MLFVINNQLVKGIKENQKGIPVIPEDYLTNVEDDSPQWPYVYIPSSKQNYRVDREPSSRVECEIGYWDYIHSTKRVCPIVFNNITILSIQLETSKEQVREWSGGFQYDRDKFKFYYHYEILLELKSGTNSQNYCFSSDDYLENNYGRHESPKLRTMDSLFKTVIPILNEFVANGFPLERLNRSYVQSCFPLKDNDYIQRHYVHNYDCFKHIIYSSQIKHAQGAYFLEIGNGTMAFVNRHVADVISDILGVRFLRESNDRYIYGIVTKLLSEIDNNDSLLLPYCMAKLFFNAENFYSSDVANRELLYSVSSDINEPITTSTLPNLYVPTSEVVRMFDFVFHIEAVHKIEGQYRAGRDDREWEVTKISFPLCDNYTPKERLINIINKVLGINLEYKEIDDYMSSTKSKYYIYTKIENDDYVPWMARDEDRGSAELRETSMKKIFNKIYQIFLSNKSEFNDLV